MTDDDAWDVSGEEPMTDAQQRMLNAACSDLSRELKWHGHRLSKDDWRHMLAGTMLGWRMLPGIDRGEGPSFIMLGGSSKKLSKSLAREAITCAFHIGDDPSSQGINAPRVRWGRAVCLARFIVRDAA